MLVGVVSFKMFLLLWVCTSASCGSMARDENGARVPDFHHLLWKLTFRLKGNPSCSCPLCTFTPPSHLPLLVQGENKQEQRSDLPYARCLPKAQVAPVVLAAPGKQRHKALLIRVFSFLKGYHCKIKHQLPPTSPSARDGQ